MKIDLLREFKELTFKGNTIVIAIGVLIRMAFNGVVDFQRPWVAATRLYQSGRTHPRISNGSQKLPKLIGNPIPGAMEFLPETTCHFSES